MNVQSEFRLSFGLPKCAQPNPVSSFFVSKLCIRLAKKNRFPSSLQAEWVEVKRTYLLSSALSSTIRSWRRGR